MPNTLENKVAIVTGSGQGIGKAIARVFAGHGAKVLVATRTGKHGQTTVDEIKRIDYTSVTVTIGRSLDSRDKSPKFDSSTHG
jgi:3-oxoacyl-[acyl-carrier protein] reductase